MESERGVCPRCGGGEVLHLYFGMPAGPEAYERLKPWERLPGCVVLDYDRDCETCGFRWQSDPAYR